MSKKKGNFHCKSEAQKKAIRAYYAKQRAEKFAPKESNVGKVYRGRTKYIDPETKHERSYVVVRDSPRGVSVSELKTIKQFDENGKNADKALVEINHERYGLSNRTGVDFQVFSQNRMSKHPLSLEDKDVFPEDKERFTLGSNDKHNMLKHVGRTGKKKK